MKRYFAAVLLIAACGGKSPPTETAPLPPEKEEAPAASCQDIGNRAAKDIETEMPPGGPADFGKEFGAMITRLCTEDAWPQDVISCGMTAEDPRKECSPKLSTQQRAHLDEEQAKMSEALMAAMGMSAGDDLSTPTGMPNCDQLRAYGAAIRDCEAAATKMGKEGLAQMIGGLAMLSQIPADQQAEVDKQCEAGVEQLAAVVTKYGCK